MNDKQLDMVLGYLNEGTEIDEISWLMESINETINQFEFVNEGKIGDKIKSAIDKIIEFIKKCIDRIIQFIKSIKDLAISKLKQARISKNDILKIKNGKKVNNESIIYEESIGSTVQTYILGDVIEIGRKLYNITGNKIDNTTIDDYINSFKLQEIPLIEFISIYGNQGIWENKFLDVLNKIKSREEEIQKAKYYIEKYDNENNKEICLSVYKTLRINIEINDDTFSKSISLVTSTISSITKLSGFVNKALDNYYNCCQKAKSYILNTAKDLNLNDLDNLYKSIGDGKDLKDAYRMIKTYL